MCAIHKQNIPKRDPQAKKITRSGMVPEKPDDRLGELDFSGAEIATSIFHHKDPVFIDYQTEGGGDMHKDACAEILKIEVDEVPKQARQATKGIWTFAQFYGSYYASCAKKGWEEYPLLVDGDGNPVMIKDMEIGDWLNTAFGSYEAFENHLKKFEHKFWHEWFKVYTQWKDEICDTYTRQGYIRSFFGFVFRGMLSRNQATNYPIQGTSFHLLLYTLIQMYKEFKRAGLQSKVLGQIHDSVVVNIAYGETETVYAIAKEVIGSLHEKFDWMLFPMKFDFEISDKKKDGGSFAKMHKYDPDAA